MNTSTNVRLNDVLVLYFSRHGSIANMAQLIARGIESIPNCQARIRTVPAVSVVNEATADRIPDHGAPYVSYEDLVQCSGIALGSPSYFGNMAADLKHFIDGSTNSWLSGSLSGKPACLFTASSSQHGGQESTLLSMMLPLFHHGAIIVGLPYSESELMTTNAGGTPYGASHWTGPDNDQVITEQEKALCIALGKRLASCAVKLA
ncbi:MAG: NAD(P)H:quinone oxidoreductase [Thiohalomonadales bacterium]